MNKKEIAKEFTRQMLDPSQPSISFGQVTDMLTEIEQTHTKIQSDMESYLIKHRMLGYAFSDSHSQLESLKEQLEKAACRRPVPDSAGRLNEQLTESSARLLKFRRSSTSKMSREAIEHAIEKLGLLGIAQLVFLNGYFSQGYLLRMQALSLQFLSYNHYTVVADQFFM